MPPLFHAACWARIVDRGLHAPLSTERSQTAGCGSESSKFSSCLRRTWCSTTSYKEGLSARVPCPVHYDSGLDWGWPWDEVNDARLWMDTTQILDMQRKYLEGRRQRKRKYSRSLCLSRLSTGHERWPVAADGESPRLKDSLKRPRPQEGRAGHKTTPKGTPELYSGP